MKFTTKDLYYVMRTILPLLLVIMLIYTSSKIINLKSDLEISNNNLTASMSEVSVLKKENGDLLYQRQSYLTTIDELEEYLSISKKDIKSLQRSLDSKISYISKLEGEISIASNSKSRDTVVVYKDSSISFKFDVRDEWYRLRGSSHVKDKIATTTIDSLYIPTPLQVGLTDKWEIFVTSDNPYITFPSITGAVIDKSKYVTRPRRWSVGVYAGMNMGMNLNGGWYVGPGVGIGIGYRLF